MPLREPIIRIRVAVADNSRIHSQLLAESLERNRDLEIVAAVSSSQELITTVTREPVDLVLVSARLDESSSGTHELIRQLRELRPNLRAVLLLESAKPESIVDAFRAGAKGVFSKLESHKNLAKCIRCVHEGQIWANRKDLVFALDALAATPAIHAVDSNGINLLSKRETEVVQCVAEGLTNGEIGERLGLSKHTIKNYLLRIFDKVGVSNRMELLFFTLSQPPGPSSATQTPATNTVPAKPAVSADDDSPLARLKLAEHYSVGNSIPRDQVSAYMWCLLAEQSNLNIGCQIETMKRALSVNMRPEQIIEAEHRALALDRKGAKTQAAYSLENQDLKVGRA
jgi:two-component system, NarL family, nitrate/nitrite response regulator NarL